MNSVPNRSPRRSERAAGESRGAGDSDRRTVLLHSQPALLGASWARDSCEGTRREGRRVEGGWPGTVPEARVRVLRHLDSELLARGMALLSVEELAVATAAAYDRAKRDWLEAARGVRAIAPANSVGAGANREP